MKSLRHRCRERGSAAFESVMALAVMLVILFCLLRFYYWSLTTSFCGYAAYYSTKAIGLGYRSVQAIRAARVAAIPVCGRNIGKNCGGPAENAEQYMIYGDGSGVLYRNWAASKEGDSVLFIMGKNTGDTGFTKVFMWNYPQEMLKIFPGLELHDPKFELSSRNYSQNYLEQ